MKFESAKKMHIDWMNVGLRVQVQQLRRKADDTSKRFRKSGAVGYREVSDYEARVYLDAADLIERAILDVGEMGDSENE